MTQAGRDPTHDGGIYGSAIAAEGWQRVTTRAFLRPITERMLDLAGISSGHRVLDVAAGTGEQTLMAARRVVSAASCWLLTSPSECSLSLQEAANNEGLTNVQTRVLDARDSHWSPELRCGHLPAGADAHPRAGQGTGRNTTRAEAREQLCCDCPVDRREEPSRQYIVGNCSSSRWIAAGAPRRPWNVRVK